MVIFPPGPVAALSSSESSCEVLVILMATAGFEGAARVAPLVNVMLPPELLTA